jgi:hypothetical protein
VRDEVLACGKTELGLASGGAAGMQTVVGDLQFLALRWWLAKAVWEDSSWTQQWEIAPLRLVRYSVGGEHPRG